MQAFGKGRVDFAMLLKDFGSEHNVIREIYGGPKPALVSTSLVERQNLTMRMSMRRFTRKSNAHSRKLVHHAARPSRPTTCTTTSPVHLRAWTGSRQRRPHR